MLLVVSCFVLLTSLSADPMCDIPSIRTSHLSITGYIIGGHGQEDTLRYPIKRIYLELVEEYQDVHISHYIDGYL